MHDRQAHNSPGEPTRDRLDDQVESRAIERSLLPGLVIVSALMTVGFAYATKMTGGDEAALWNLGFVIASMAFLGLFVRLLLARATSSVRSMQGWEHQHEGSEPSRAARER